MKSVVKYPDTVVIAFANKLLKTFKFVIEEVADKNWFAARFVTVKFDTVVEASVEDPEADIFVAFKAVGLSVAIERFVIVALVIVALVPIAFIKLVDVELVVDA